MKKRIIAMILLVGIILTTLPLDVMAREQTNDTSSLEPKRTVSEKKIKRYTILLVDNSGSMSGKPMQRLKKTAKVFAKKIIKNKDENYIAIIPFNTGYSSKKIDFTNDLAMLDVIEKYYASGGTPTDEALIEASNLIDKIENDDNSKIVKNVVVFSDGAPNNKYRAINAAKALQEKCDVYSVAYLNKAPRNEYEREIMQNIQNAGYFEINDDEDWDIEFGKIQDKIEDNNRYKKGKFRYPGELNKDSDSTGTYYYTDEYFAKPSTQYDSSLATMSLALELASWVSYDKSNWYNPKISPNDPGFYDDRLVNLKTLLLGNPNLNDEDYTGIGFKGFEANKDWEKNPTRDSIGLACAYKNIKVNDEDSTVIALVIRGGGYASEWSSNATVGTKGNHEGFEKASNDAISFLDNYLSKQSDINENNLKLWIVGYSRAGATANLVGGKLKDGYVFSNEKKVKSSNIYCYTFATPMGLNGEKQSTCENVYNTLSLNDMVPLVAPKNWGFTRYNRTNQNKEIYFPTKSSVGDFNSYKIEMLKQFNNLTFKDSDYKIDEEYTWRMYDGIDFEKTDKGFLKYKIKINTSRNFERSLVLNNFVDFISDDLLENRAMYNYAFEDIFRDIAFYRKGDGNMLLALQETFDSKNLPYFMEPFLSFSLRSQEQRLAESVNRMYEKFYQSEHGFQIPNIIQADIVLRKTFNLIAFELSLVNNFASRFTVNNFNTFNLGLKAAINFQPHYPEITLAWCMSNDKNYTGKASKKFSSKTRVIRINCPVDVIVYDDSGNYCGGIQNDISDNKETSLISYVDGNDQKVIFLPSDTGYKIDIIAREETPVSVDIGEFDLSTNSYERLENYYDMQVGKGEKIKASIPALSESELFGNTNGSNAKYSISYKGTQVVPSNETLGDDSNETYKLDVSKEGTGGVVLGGGEFIKGEFVKIKAACLPGGDFYGWYENGTLISKNSELRIPVRSDRSLVAKFSDVEYYNTLIESTEGGTVNYPESKYPASVMTDTFIARPNNGYKFLRWESNDINIENPENPELSFITPKKDVNIKAIFVSYGTSNNSNENKGNSILDTNDEIKFKTHEKVETVPVYASINSNTSESKVEKIPYIFGYPDGTFKPNNNLTRAEAVSMIVRLMDISDVENNEVFKDTPATHWAAKDINKAYAKGILKEKQGENFRPEDKITRAELSYILANIISGDTKETNLTDIKDNWAEESIKKLYNSKIIAGYPDKTFRPDNPVTRAELVTMINKAFSLERDLDFTKVSSPFTDVTKDHWAYKNIMIAAVKLD